MARDADIGRTYLPREDCERFGYSAADLVGRVTNAAFVRLMQFEVARARSFLLSVRHLAPRVPGRMSVAIDLFGAGGLRICDRIESLNYRVWEKRPIVTKWDAMTLLSRCLLRAAGRLIGVSGRASVKDQNTTRPISVTRSVSEGERSKR